VKLDASDITDLKPLIETVARAAVDEIRRDEAALDSRRLAYPEAEAAAILGVRKHVLGAARRAGLLQASRLGKQTLYSRDELLRFLRDGGVDR
jgi:hypothetical protein